jgi:predicted RNase H-like HicB family nuclease
MNRVRYVYWQEEDMWLGYVDEFPDYQTQGETLDELKENLTDIYRDVTNGDVPNVRRVAEMMMP